jgi:N-acetylmuramoyl-L-alanine amidase
MTKVLVLDAGHGIGTAGKQTLHGSAGVVKEWTLNNAVCNYIADILKDYDVTIHRTDDTSGKTDVSLSERVKRCNQYNPDLFISIHHNAHNSVWGDHSGTEVYYHTNGTAEDKKVAGLLAPKLASACGVRNRGVKHAKCQS